MTENRNFRLLLIGSVLISALSAFFIWFQTSKYGIGISPDSTTYLRWSENISKDGFSFILGNKDTTFPPFYPLLISFLGKLFNVDSLTAARWLNIFLAFCFSFLSVMLLYKNVTKNLAICLLFGLFIVFSRPINLVFSHAWSEPLFIFILSLFLFVLETTTYKRLILCGLLTVFAILTRWAGVAVIPAVCLYVFIQKSIIAEKIKKSFCYATIPTLVYILYMFRNYYFTGTLMGYRTSSNSTLISNCDRAISTVAFWYTGSFSFLAITLSFFLGAYIWNYRHEFWEFITKWKNAEQIKFSICFLVVYSSFIIITSTTTAYDLIDDRLMSPVFLTTLLLVFSLVVFVFKTPKKGRVLYYVLFSVFIVCTMVSFAKAWSKDIVFRKNYGIGYNSTFWRENELSNYLKQHRDIFQRVVYTNNPYSFFLIDKTLKPKSVPQKKHRNSNNFTEVNLENLGKKYPDFEGSNLAYFNEGDTQEYFTLTELRSLCQMETVVETSDGFLLRVGKCNKK
ncbi:hypothetical protein J6Z39_03670 [bacterium]|nr:hypothetical protein [bacterium]